MFYYIWIALNVLLWALLSLVVFIAFTSVIRKHVDAYPNTWIYKAVKLIDDLVISAILMTTIPDRPPQGKQTQRSDNFTIVQSLHDHFSIAGPVYIRHSFTTSIDLGNRIPKRIFETLGSPGVSVVGILVAIVLLGPLYMTAIILADLSPFATMIAYIMGGGVLSAGLYVFFFSPDSIIFVLQRLNNIRFLVIVIDKRIITTDSAWGTYVYNNDDNVTLAVKDDGLLHGVYLILSRDGVKRQRWLFRIPSVIARQSFAEGDMLKLCTQLDVLRAKARNLPDVNLDELH